MHSSYVESKGCNFLFYGVIRKKVNCCVCSGWFPVYEYVYFKFGVSACHCRSRKAMELCSSYVGLSFMLLCILFIYVLMVCKLILVVSYMTNMSSTYHT